MWELLMLFVKEPNKIKRLGIAFGKLSLSLVFALYIFDEVFPHDALRFNEPFRWLSFEVYGTILSWALILISCYFVVFEIICEGLLIPIVSRLIRLIVQKKDSWQEEFQYIFRIASWYGIIKYDSKKKEVYGGKHSMAFYQLIKSYADKGEALDLLDDTLLKKLFGFFLAFQIAYFGLFKMDSVSLTWLIIAWDVFLVYLLFVIEVITVTLEQHYRKVLHFFEYLVLEDRIKDTVCDLHLTYEELENRKILVRLGSEEIIFLLAYHPSPISIGKLRRIVGDESSRSVYILTNSTYSSEEINFPGGSLRVKKFNDNEELTELVKSTILERISAKRKQ